MYYFIGLKLLLLLLLFPLKPDLTQSQRRRRAIAQTIALLTSFI